MGMTTLFKMIGSSIGPVIAGIYMQTNEASVKGVVGSFPSSDSYNLIFLTLALTSVMPVVLAIFIRNRLKLLSALESVSVEKP